MNCNYIAINNTRISWIDSNKILRSIKYYVYAPESSYSVYSLHYDRFDNIENCNSVLATYDLNIALLECGEVVVVSKNFNILSKSNLNRIGFVSLMCLSSNYLCLLNNENILYILNVNNLSNIIQFNDVINIQAYCEFNYVVFKMKNVWCVYTEEMHLHLLQAYDTVCMQTNDLICTSSDNLVWHVYWDVDGLHANLLNLSIIITKVCMYGKHTLFTNSMNKLNSVMISKYKDSGMHTILDFGSTYKNSTDCMVLDKITNTPKFIDGFTEYLDCVDGSQNKNLQYLDIDRVMIDNCYGYMIIKYKMQYKIYKLTIYVDSIYLPENFTLYEDEGGDYI